MPPLTLNQAAKAASKSKSALLQAIKSGRLSAARDDKNQWQIEPAELFRVYPQNRSSTSSENHHLPVNKGESEPPEQLEQRLMMVMAEREREREQLQATIDDLRKRLDLESAERRKLTALITHQPEQKPESINRLFEKIFKTVSKN